MVFKINIQNISTQVKLAKLKEIEAELLFYEVAANSALRKAFEALAQKNKIQAHIPPFEYCTDNAAMIAMVGYLKFKMGKFGNQTQVANARMEFDVYQ